MIRNNSSYQPYKSRADNNKINNLKISYSDENKNLFYTYDTSRNNKGNRSNIKFNYISLTTHRTNPDIYLNNREILRGREYRIIDKPVEENSTDTASDTTSLDSSFNEYNYLKNQTFRYFHPVNLTRKCSICKEIGHTAYWCNNETYISNNTCFRCNQTGHLDFQCNNKNNIRCFKCKQLGHKNKECKMEDTNKCFRCNNIGHLAQDCLIIPTKIDTKIIGECYFCQADEHLICPSKINSVFISNDCMENINNYKKLSCPRCASDNHNLNNCGFNSKYNNK